MDNKKLATPSEEMDAKNQEQASKNQRDEEPAFDSYDTAWDEIDLDNPNIIFDNEDEKKTEEEVNEVLNEKLEKEREIAEKGGLVADEPKDTETEAKIEVKKDGKIVIDEPIKYKGKLITIDDKEEAYALMQKGFKLEQEMSKIKPYKRMIAVIEDAGINEEDIQALADLKSGKKEALNYFASAYGVDVFDIGNKEYKPEVKEIKEENADELEEYFRELGEDNPELAGKVASVYNELPDEFKVEVYKPNIFQAFVNSVETGEFDKVYPIALKYKTLNPAVSWRDAYAYGASKVLGNEELEEKEVKEPSKELETPKEERNIDNWDSEYDRVWEDDEYFRNLEKELFGG